MRIVVASLLAISGMYAFALFGPVSLTMQGLVWGIAIMSGLFIAVACVAFNDDED